MKKEKKEALAGFHRRTIQDAAEKLFLEKGLDATSVEEIAEAAGYSKATLYVYFKGKTDIWDHILLSAMKMLKDNVENVVASDCATVEKYFAVCKVLVDFSEEYPLYFESLLGPIFWEEEGVSRQTYEIGEEIMGAVSKFVAQGIEESVVDPDVRFSQIAFILWSCVSGMIRMANQKEAYYTAAIGCEKQELLRYGFEVLLKSITK